MPHQGIEYNVHPKVTAINPINKVTISNSWIGLSKTYIPNEIRGKPKISHTLHPIFGTNLS